MASETFAVAWRRRDEVPSQPLPWLLGVARRVLANAHRSERRRMALVDRLAAEPKSGAGEEAALPILAALARVSEPDREVLRLAAWEELSAREGAEVLGCSPVAFRIRLHRARRRLASALADLEREANPGHTELRLNTEERAS